MVGHAFDLSSVQAEFKFMFLSIATRVITDFDFHTHQIWTSAIEIMVFSFVFLSLFFSNVCVFTCVQRPEDILGCHSS